ncbi:hypothetical protein [Almyronema epifaneia]|uniref:Uncharacterized protein n=1 Tax=Almyronema epifaneia S1 TaxID=2991925 RepID=A0ABW6II03_9CYAN
MNAIRKTADRVLAGMLALEFLLAVIYLVGVFQTGQPWAAFDFDGLRTVPSLLQSAHLFLLGLVPAVVMGLAQPNKRSPSRSLLLALTVLFLYAALDETFKFHLTLGHQAWRFVYIGAGTAIPVVFHRQLHRLWHQYRRAVKFAIAGFVVFVLGGFGTELLKIYLLAPAFAALPVRYGGLTAELEAVRVAIEEFAELVGESLTLYGMSLVAAECLTPAPEPNDPPQI